MTNNKTPYLIIIIVVLFITSLLFYKYYPSEITGDPLTYHNIAVTLASFETQQYSGDDIAIAITPGYPVIISICYLIAGQIPLTVYVLQSLFYLFSILIIYYLLKESTSKTFALIGAIALALYVELWKMSIGLMMEVPSVFFLMLLLFIIFIYFRNENTGILIWFNLIFCVLIFINNRFIVHYLAFISVIIFAKIFKWYNFKVSNLLLSLLIVVLFLFTWHLRQYIVFDKIVLFAPKRMVDVEAFGGFKSYDEYKSGIKNSGYSDESKKMFEEQFIIKKYEELKSEYENRQGIKIYLSRAKEFWRIAQFEISLSPGDNRIVPPASLSKNMLNIITLLPFFLFALAGVYYTFKCKNVFYLLIFSFIMAHWALHTVVHYIPRYRLTIIPLIVMLAIYGGFNIFYFLKNKYEGNL